ncbi:contact-dependent growth inhibition system immunity protein [Alicyclobacillus sendaiensis]|uniref:Contact-dependent growth inhibition system immunity protein n=1 Tax=Alicyclobacillus sendaiensis PA2 TaxID=3029425 RepID=A0ABT6XTZ5_ALISE|nr:contact-dependent growth inhibition system immunity protein [Alicyclobacillus sendaiensis]MDI9258565.1 contact-dependent growth inhibition system immunity protein [Alicyclobacillus sendaiensis PA2]
MKPEFEERLKHFLGGYWHQDVPSTESGLQDVFVEQSPEDIRELTRIIRTFLEESADPDSKRAFIDHWADGVVTDDPIGWLQGIMRKMEEFVGADNGSE